MDRFTRRLINGILLCLLVVGISVAIWEAIPTIIKAMAVIGIAVGFFRMVHRE